MSKAQASGYPRDQPASRETAEAEWGWSSIWKPEKGFLKKELESKGFFRGTVTLGAQVPHSVRSPSQCLYRAV